MTISDGIMILAVLLSPVLAVQVQKWIERAREVRQRKLLIFQTLMATRAARVSFEHVRALNMIDLEFYGRRLLGLRWQAESERAVVQAWNSYRDSLNDPANFRDEEGLRRRENAFVALFFAMSRDLGYDFDRVYLNKSAYSPVAHADLELDQHRIRKGLIEVLEAQRPISVARWTADARRQPPPEVVPGDQGGPAGPAVRT